jgi:hypothetical protein
MPTMLDAIAPNRPKTNGPARAKTTAKAGNVDPALSAAEQLEQLWDRAAVLEAEKARPAVEDDNYDRRDILMDYATMIHAQSIPGALFQAKLVSSFLERIDNHIEVGGRGLSNSEMKSLVVKMGRLLFSIADVLREHADGIEPTRDIYMSERQNPWKMAGDACL